MTLKKGLRRVRRETPMVLRLGCWEAQPPVTGRAGGRKTKAASRPLMVIVSGVCMCCPGSAYMLHGPPSLLFLLGCRSGLLPGGRDGGSVSRFAVVEEQPPGRRVGLPVSPLE